MSGAGRRLLTEWYTVCAEANHVCYHAVGFGMYIQYVPRLGRTMASIGCPAGWRQEREGRRSEGAIDMLEPVGFKWDAI